jgi:uncharacterized damage-inducible protein DinB
MSKKQYAQFAIYNQWMNRKHFDAAAVIGDEYLHRNSGAFFGSIFGTLNHLAVADTLLFKRHCRAHVSGPTAVQHADGNDGPANNAG